MNEHAPRAKFRSMDEGTAEDWAVIGSHFFPYAKGLADRVMTHLRLLDGDYGGFPIDRLQHSLQTATRAHRGGEAEDYVVMALVHDIGDTLATLNHPDVAAAILKPFVDEKLHWIVRASRHLPGLLFLPLPRDRPRHARAVPWPCPFRGHRPLLRALRPDRVRRRLMIRAPLVFFEPMVRRVFAAPKRSIYVSTAEYRTTS